MIPRIAPNMRVVIRYNFRLSLNLVLSLKFLKVCNLEIHDGTIKNGKCIFPTLKERNASLSPGVHTKQNIQLEHSSHPVTLAAAGLKGEYTVQSPAELKMGIVNFA